MKLAYISPSVLPSRSANSVHVVQQCEALGKLGVDVTLFAKRAEPSGDLREELRRAYGVELERVTLSTVYTRWARANNLTIALHALFRPSSLVRPNLLKQRHRPRLAPVNHRRLLDPRLIERRRHDLGCRIRDRPGRRNSVHQRFVKANVDVHGTSEAE